MFSHFSWARRCATKDKLMISRFTTVRRDEHSPPTGGVNISPTVIILGQVPDYSRTFLQFSIYCLFRVCNLSDVIPAVSEPAHLVAHERTQHSIVVRPTAVRAILTDIICQTIVQHCRAPDLELTATCCVKLRLSLSLLSNPECTMEVAIVLAV